jgi:hypothetical protein
MFFDCAIVEAMAETQTPSAEPAARLQRRTSHLVIVSREHPAVFDRLCERFADAPGLRVIFDRRKTRHAPQQMLERRERDSTERRLATQGFIVVPIRR